MKTQYDEKISFKKGCYPYDRNEVLGRLTERQLSALREVVRLSPNYAFFVMSYSDPKGKGSSSATHVFVMKDKIQVGLVGSDTAQFYDKREKTKKVVLRVAHRVYKWTPNFE